MSKPAIKADITYTVGRTPKGRLFLQKDYCTVFIPDSMENNALTSSIEVDLEFAYYDGPPPKQEEE